MRLDAVEGRRVAARRRQAVVFAGDALDAALVTAAPGRGRRQARCSPSTCATRGSTPMDGAWVVPWAAGDPQHRTAFDDVPAVTGRPSRLVPASARVLVGRHRRRGLLVRRGAVGLARRVFEPPGTARTTRCSPCTWARWTSGCSPRGRAWTHAADGSTRPVRRPAAVGTSSRGRPRRRPCGWPDASAPSSPALRGRPPIASHALGPGPLTQEAEHAKRDADLRIYLRQQHAERDSRRPGPRPAPQRRDRRGDLRRAGAGHARPRRGRPTDGSVAAAGARPSLGPHDRGGRPPRRRDPRCRRPAPAPVALGAPGRGGDRLRRRGLAPRLADDSTRSPGRPRAVEVERALSRLSPGRPPGAWAPRRRAGRSRATPSPERTRPGAVLSGSRSGAPPTARRAVARRRAPRPPGRR